LALLRYRQDVRLQVRQSVARRGQIRHHLDGHGHPVRRQGVRYDVDDGHLQRQVA